MDLGGRYYNTKAQLRKLEDLLRKLPDPTAPVVQTERPVVPRRSKRVDPDLEQEVVRGYQDGATISELGRRYGLDRRIVRRVLRRHGVEQRQRGLSAEQVGEAAQLYESGWTLARIGERMDVDPTTVLKRLRERAVTTRRPGRPRTRL